MDQTPAAIPWYRSNVLRGILVATIAGIASRFHLTAKFAPDASQIADTLLDLVSLAGAAYAAQARVRKPMPVVTTTKAQAEAINNAPAPPVLTEVVPPKKKRRRKKR
jgi:hypothetical protein